MSTRGTRRETVERRTTVGEEVSAVTLTMNDGLVRREAARPRRASAAAELGANANPQYGEVIEVHPPRESQPGSDRLAAAAGRMERRNSASQLVHQRHMPMEPLKFHIPRKTKENRGGMAPRLPTVQYRRDFKPKNVY